MYDGLYKQEALVSNSRMLSFEMTRTVWKTKLNGGTQEHWKVIS
jgi:hypothetical protein